MPSYFFHLGFELYPQPLPDLPQRPPPPQIYLPPPGADIFSSLLPVHSIGSWGATVTPRRRTHHRSKTASASEFDFRARPSLPERRFSQATRSELSEVPKPVARGDQAPKSAVGAKDWRFGPVSIQSIDMEEAHRGKDGSEQGRSRGKSVDHTGPSSSGLTTRGKYIPSDPKNTAVGWGVVHLYREAIDTPGLQDDTTSSSGSDNGKLGDASRMGAFNVADCTTLCILAVPSYMTPSDLLGFVGEQTREEVSHFRLIRTERANKYMVLMKFRDPTNAKKWQKEWNGKLFNSMEPENCHVVFIKTVHFSSADANQDPSSFPHMSNDPFAPSFRSVPTAPLPTSPTSPIGTEHSKSLASSLSTKPLAPPTPALIELPTCPVCLERMDETTGLLTILCQHVFHCACLEKWRGSGCPVCRYTQNDTMLRRGQSADDTTENECSVCGSTSNLWICLICGNVGCGRYDSAHAFAHYEATSHSFAMDIASQHVWDYAGDGYVHRLIQNKADGKLVDLPAAYGNHPNTAMTGVPPDTVPREKLDNMGMEYAFLLTSQLDSQRAYFEGQVERAVDKASMAASTAEDLSRVASGLAAELTAVNARVDESAETIKSLERDLARATARAEKSENLARKLGKDWREEKTVSESLMERISFLDGKVKELGGQVESLQLEKSELEEQNRDLSFFISGSKKLKEEGMGEEVVEGKVEVPAPPQEGSGRKKKGKGKK
ncbi:RING-10 protein [Lineolata rhizophorae]|uniref:RING-10 protein n=1 Tax=Lineolata rhizophorae TaxID=578093 RepID=A0A6A6P9N7_9PEZI|nr:RING-10 protein [Lineolata rhizophorae]